MRSAVTILYNGLHHLQHNGFAQFMVDNFDYWAVVDGLSHNGGSTAWCNRLDMPPCSTDGSVEFMRDLAMTHSNVLHYVAKKPFRSKDEQVNMCIDLLRKQIKRGWLWQVDVDEQWTAEQLDDAEQRLFFSPMREAAFRFYHFVGKGIYADGKWGNDHVSRLFKWRGQKFISHEPSRMDSAGRVLLIDDIRFNHYSYYFETDVIHKDKYYKGYEGIHPNWLKLQTMTEFPQPLSVLMPVTSKQYNDNTKIVKYEQSL